MVERPDLGDVLRSHGIPDSALHPLGDTGSCYLEIPGAEVVARWSALRNIFEETGYWPLLLGGADDLARHKQALADPHLPDSDQILVDARTLDSQAWLRGRLDLFHLAHAEVLDDLHEQ